MALRVLTWNLFHGRSVPGAGRALLPEFAELIAGWDWDVALLQEVQPWWPPELARAAGAQERTVLTSRNFLLPVRRWIAERWPDVVKANGGGANAILSRRPIADHASQRLRWLPERRVAHAVRLADGTCLANLHASKSPPARSQADVDRARAFALAFAGGAPLVLGGDLNVREPRVPDFEHVASHHVDHLFASGLAPLEPGRTLRRGRLSDHAPLVGVVA